MNNEYVCNLSELLEVFSENISASDILASKALAQISTAITDYRIKTGMTQKEFAEYMNVTQGMVSKWESKDYNFSVKSLADIATKLEMDLDIRLHTPITKREMVSEKRIAKNIPIKNIVYVYYNSEKRMGNITNGNSYIRPMSKFTTRVGKGNSNYVELR